MKRQPTFFCVGLGAALLLAACAPPWVDRGREEPEPASPEVLTLGEEIYQTTAGGTGCQACHGMDAQGIQGVAPNIAGRSASSIERALARVPQMRHITLSESEIQAVAAYLETLR